MKREVLATLADKNYINHAKQLFSSVYFNAGWKGDYMLLAHEIPEKELRWFRDRGILVKKCKPLYDKKIGRFGHPPVVLSKFYLFSQELKKWKTVVFLDSDIIVRASLDELTGVSGFSAYYADSPFYKTRLIGQFNKKLDGDVLDSLKKNYDLNSYSFNAGVMAFNTDIIEKGSIPELKRLLGLYGEISSCEGILNLFFHKRWSRISQVYNVRPDHILTYSDTKPENIKGIILHLCFTSKELPVDYFQEEYNYNLERADSINLDEINPGRKLSKLEIKKRSFSLKSIFVYIKIKSYFAPKIKSAILSVDRNIGLVGIFLNRHFPRLYLKHKRVKKWLGFEKRRAGS